MATFFLGGAVLLAPALLVADTDGLTTGKGIAMVFWLGVATTAVSYVLFSAGLQRLQSSTVATLSLTEPLTAALLGVLVLGERPGLVAVLGALVLLSGLLVIDDRARTPSPSPSPERRASLRPAGSWGPNDGSGVQRGLAVEHVVDHGEVVEGDGDLAGAPGGDQELGVLAGGQPVGVVGPVGQVGVPVLQPEAGEALVLALVGAMARRSATISVRISLASATTTARSSGEVASWAGGQVVDPGDGVGADGLAPVGKVSSSSSSGTPGSAIRNR